MDYSNDPKIIDGKKLAILRQAKLVKKIKTLSKKPLVVSILIGDNAPSLLYTKMKQKKALEIGIDFSFKHLSSDISFDQVVDLIQQLNQDQSVTGIMIQLPLPKNFLGVHITQDLLNIIDPKKDIDGLAVGSSFHTAAVVAVFDILEDEMIQIRGKKAAVIGASYLIGQPIAQGLQKRGATVEICDSRTANLFSITQSADILVSATGVGGLIIGKMVKEGVVAIDVGVMVLEESKEGERTKYEEEKKIIGDIDFETVYPKASKITPVPGGVGPMTVISLMENVLKVF